MDTINQNVVLIGAGNVATHLGLAFKDAGIPVLQVYSRSLKAAGELAEQIGCDATDRLEKLSPDAAIYVMAVSDDAIEDVAAAFPYPDKLLVHTSGSVDMQALKKGSRRYGVFYPLQTFTKGRQADFFHIPLCLEVAGQDDGKLLQALAYCVTDNVAWVSSETRRQLHVAAVFACNFVNHMYAVAADMMESHGLSFDMLRPLIAETASKAEEKDPRLVQTGPARRNNTSILEKHEHMLADQPAWQKMYHFISEDIRKKYNNEQ